MKRVTLIVAILIFALGIRLLFLYSGGVTLDSDEAIVGLMAKHILEGREWPIFYYGQHYMGSLEPTLTSLAFSALGQNQWTLKTIPLFFSLIFVYQVILLAEKFAPKSAALPRSAAIAGLLAAVPPVGFVEWSTKARGGFIELVCLGTAGLLMAISIARARELRISQLSFLAFVLGVAWWVNNQAIFYIASIGLYLAWSLIKTWGLKEALKKGSVSSIFFFIGGLPFWYYNLLTLPRFQTFKQLGGRAKFPGEFIDHLSGFFTEAVPILLGARRFWTKVDLFAHSAEFAYAIGVVALSVSLIVLFSKKSDQKYDSRGTALLNIFLLVVPVIFALSSFGWLTTAPRYLLPLYSVWFVILTLKANTVPGMILPSMFFGLSLLSNYMGGVSIPGQPYIANGQRVASDHSELNKWLVKHNIPHIYTNYWIGYRVAFETDEQVTFSIYSEPFTVRIPRYEHIGEEYADVAPFVLVPSQEEDVSIALSELGIPFERTMVSGYVILTPLSHTQAHPKDEIGLRFTSGSSREDWLKRLSDNQSGSRWGSGQPQRPGMYLEANFDSEQEVRDIEVDVGFWISDAARHLSVQLIEPDGKQCIVFDGSTLPLHNFFGPKVNFPLRPEPAVGIRLEQDGSDPIFDWSVAEVKVFKHLEEDN